MARPKKQKAPPARIVNAERLAVFLNLTKQRVHQLVAEGLPRKLRGKYDLDEAARFYIRYLQAALEKKAIPLEGRELVSEQHERLRKMRIEADLKELQLARERGLLVAVDDVEREFADLTISTKARIMAVAPRLAPELLGETSRLMIQGRIEKSLKEALLQLAEKGSVHA